MHSNSFLPQIQQAHLEGIHGSEVLVLQAYLGSAWAVGCCLFGAIVVNHSKECQISKQYLCQVSLLLTGVSIFGLTAVEGYNGYVMFVWIYGVFCGGYNYTLKMYIYEKVRARNFARAWGFAQFAMAVPLFFGVPITGISSLISMKNSIIRWDSQFYVSGYINGGLGEKRGFHFSGFFVVAGALAMILIDVHRKNLRKRRRLRHKRALSKKSLGNGSIGTASGMQGGTQSTHHSQVRGNERIGKKVVCHFAVRCLWPPIGEVVGGGS